jgi:hypothetical protein
VPDSDTLYGPTVADANGNPFGTTYFAWPGDSTIVYPLLHASNPNFSKYGINWTFISPDAYPPFVAKMALYKMLNKAEALGVSTDAAAAVYNNASSTVDELNAALKNLTVDVNSSAINGATATSPKDATGYIVNPDMATDVSGWTLDGTKGSGNIGAYGYTAMESWNSTNYDIHQFVSGLPDGVYKLGVKGFYRAGGYDAAATSRTAGTEALNAYLYAATDSVTLQSLFTGAGMNGSTGVSTSLGYVPNSMEQARSYFNAGAYGDNAILFYNANKDNLRIGVKKWNHIGDDWTIFSNFTLTYYGNGNDAVKLILKTAIDKATPYSEITDKMGADVMDALTTALANANTLYNGDAPTIDQVKEASSALTTATSAISASVAAYKAMNSALQDAENCLNTYGGDDLSDYYGEMQPAYEEGSLTTEQCNEAVTKIADLIATAKATAIKVGDCTSIIVNPSFENPLATGWTSDGDKGTVSYSEVEVFNNTFDIHQTIKNIRNGKYTLKCQGFQRCGANATADAGFTAGTNNITAMLYANVNEAKLTDVMAEASATQLYTSTDWQVDYQTSAGKYTPNSMVGTRNYFDAGLYANNTVSTVVTNNTLTIGVKEIALPTTADSWVLFDNFTLAYEGDDATVLASTLNDLIATAQGLSSSAMNADSLAVLKAAIAEGQAATTNAMTPIAHLNTAIPAARTSIAKYETLAAQLKLVEDTIAAGTHVDALTALSNVYTEYNDKFTAGSIADADIPAAVLALKAAINAYLTSNASQATDSNPLDFTGIIINANFDDGTNGWTGAGTVSASEMEQYNKTFDLNQTIVGVPNGTYKLSVTGFYRAGGYVVGATAHVGGTEVLNAILYANSYSNPIMSIFADPTDNADLAANGFVQVSVPFNGKDSSYVANSMDAARIAFDEGKYQANSLMFNVTDNTITLGIKKSVTIDTDWTIFDAFRLTYYGTNSANGINMTNNNANVVNRTYYTINGMRSSRLTRGINIVKTMMSDGSIKISKVLVK